MHAHGAIGIMSAIGAVEGSRRSRPLRRYKSAYRASPHPGTGRLQLRSQVRGIRASALIQIFGVWYVVSQIFTRIKTIVIDQNRAAHAVELRRVGRLLVTTEVMSEGSDANEWVACLRSQGKRWRLSSYCPYR